jgi:SAM-dependent methyltransferase
MAPVRRPGRKAATIPLGRGFVRGSYVWLRLRALPRLTRGWWAIPRRLDEWRRPDAGRLTRKNTRRAYEKLYAADKYLEDYLRPERIAFYEEVAEAALSVAPAHVLDVGCGSGHLLRELADRRPDLELVGFDHAKSAIARTREIVPEARAFVGSIYKVRAGRHFDLVLCVEVLEHLNDPETALRTLVEHCRPGGTILITVPDGDLDEWEGHVNFWNERELAAMLKPLGRADVQRISGGVALLALVEPS